MTRTGLICSVGVLLLAAGGGWYWFHHPHAPRDDEGRNTLARQDELKLVLGLEMFRKSFGAYPIGGNPAIIKALGGENSRHAKIFNPRKDAINSAGVFTDPWGTAYEINISLEAGPVVRSAGKNKKSGDADDVVTDRTAFMGAKP